MPGSFVPAGGDWQFQPWMNGTVKTVSQVKKALQMQGFSQLIEYEPSGARALITIA